MFGSSVDKDIQQVQQQLNFVTGQITQTKNLLRQMEGIIAGHETNKVRLEKELEKLYKRKKNGT